MDSTPALTGSATVGSAGESSADRQRIVVGVDGSPGARAALVWALLAAARRRADVEVVAAFAVDYYWMDPYLADPGRLEAVRADTRVRALAMVDDVRGDAEVNAALASADVGIDVVVAAGGVAEHLVQRAEDADLLVVGSRGRGGVRSTVLGSVALHCAAHAVCPVVVVHPSAAPSSPATVVVGLEDTDLARAALVAAVEEAGRLGARVDAVLVHEAPDLWSDLGPVVDPSPGAGPGQFAQRGEALLTEVLGPDALADGSVRVVAVQGRPAESLVGHAEGAALLVVGSRSRSRIQGMVLGSVALHCVVHASCPVMVVHRRPADRTSSPAVAAAARG